MTKDDKVLAYSMRLDGYSFREIAEKLGVSIQAVQKAIPPVENRVIKRTVTCIYPNIYAWMRKNDINIDKLSNLCSVSYMTIKRMLIGESETRKSTIDKILEVTGMTYEEAFKKAEKDEQL